MTVLDFDYLEPGGPTVRSRWLTPADFYRDFLRRYISPNWITATEKGYQVAILWKDGPTSEHKSYRLLQAIKRGFMTIPHIDQVASSRNNGIFRNPLRHEHLVLSLDGQSLETYRQWAKIAKISPKTHKSRGEPKEDEKNVSGAVKRIILGLRAGTVLKVGEGFRKATLFQLVMLEARRLHKMDSLSPGALYAWAREQNDRYMSPPLDSSEVVEVVNSAVGYTEAGKNFVKDPAEGNTTKTTKKESKMSRSEHIKKVHASRKAKTRAQIQAILSDMFVQDQIRTKSGKLKAAAIARILKLKPHTVGAHLKEMGLV